MAQGRSFWKANNNDRMKFNAIVGNPPYQTQSNDLRDTSRDMPIYNLFVECSKNIDTQYISLIIPARWMATGLGLSDFRESMLSDKHLRKLVDYPMTRDVFPSVDIMGGVCYFLIDNNYNGEGECLVISSRDNKRSEAVARKLNEFDIFVRDSFSLIILRKVLATQSESIMGVLSVDKEFGWTSNFDGFRDVSNGNDIPLYYKRGIRRIGYIDREDVKKSRDLIDKWKVMIPKAHGGQGVPDVVLGPSFVAPSPSVCTQTFLFLYSDSENEAINMNKYVKTKFVRFLISLRKITQDATRSTYKWVPLQDFTSSSDIDWSVSVDAIDRQLYDKYGLTADERAFIERMIKPM